MIGPSTIVVTGLGAVHAAGCGRRRTAEALAAAAPVWSEVDRIAGDRIPSFHRPGGSRLAGLARHDLSPWVKGGVARRMSLPSKFAVAAAEMALAEAGLEAGEELAGRPTAVVLANAFGPSQFTERILAQVEDGGPQTVSPALFTESVANAPAAQVAIACRAVGASITVTQRQAGALIALGRAATEIARGRAGCVLLVTVDEVTPLFHAVLDRYRALARPGADGETARPFDRHRDGFVIAEGATALVVESAASAADRGATVLARLVATAGAFDPRTPTSGWGPDAEVLAPRLRRLLTAAAPDLGGRDIAAVVSGASGAVAGDRLEAEVLGAVWGSRLPPVLAPKAVLGEYGGAQLAAAVLALGGESFGATPGFRRVDPALGVTPHVGGPLVSSPLLVSSLATGGAAA